MERVLILIFTCVFALSLDLSAKDTYETDFIKADGGGLMITFIGHASLMLVYQGKVIQVDPVSREADYSGLPKADLVLITHEHGDHLDPAAIAGTAKETTEIILPEESAKKLGRGTVMKNGEVKTALGFKIEAVPAYNLVHVRDSGEPYHPKGRGNGYVVSIGNLRVYIAGDTENTPEMKALEDIDIAFLPMNLPYTMTPAMVADAVRSFRPKILYPYHYGNTDVQELKKLLAGDSGIELRVRDMK